MTQDPRGRVIPEHRGHAQLTLVGAVRHASPVPRAGSIRCPRLPPWWKEVQLAPEATFTMRFSRGQSATASDAVPHRLRLAVGRRHGTGVQVVPADHQRRLHAARPHQVVEDLPRPVPLPVAEPADARGQPHVLHALPGHVAATGPSALFRGTPGAAPRPWPRCPRDRRRARPSGTAPPPRRTAGGCTPGTKPG